MDDEFLRTMQYVDQRAEELIDSMKGDWENFAGQIEVMARIAEALKFGHAMGVLLFGQTKLYEMMEERHADNK